MAMTHDDMFSMEEPKLATDGINLSPEQEKAINDVLENRQNNYFITGAAGTGKSTILRLLRKYITNSVVCAPTGVAAMNVEGQTLHSMFSIPPRIVTRKDAAKLWDENRLRMFRNLRTIFIDEISMVSCYILDYIDEFLRINVNKDLPFGGIQIVMIGDLGQLPPVVTRMDADILYSMYTSVFFFAAEVMRTGKFKVEYLRQVFRQSDPKFLSLLDAIKRDEVTDEQFEMLNSRVYSAPENAVFLTATNDISDRINHERLAEINEPEYTYKANISGEYNAKLCKAPAELKLKIGARVMHLVNNSVLGLVNGSVGTVTALSDTMIEVKFGDKLPVQISAHTWSNKKIKFNPIDLQISENEIGGFTQYPLTLAWATSIHKSQGMTLERIHIDTGAGMFASGMFYVALSRCKTFEGVTLERHILKSDIIIDKKVSEFYKKFNIKFY